MIIAKGAPVIIKLNESVTLLTGTELWGQPVGMGAVDFLNSALPGVPALNYWGAAGWAAGMAGKAYDYYKSHH